jgi:hypothetical protein
VFGRHPDIITRVARSTSYLGHTPVGWQVMTAEQPVIAARWEMTGVDPKMVMEHHFRGPHPRGSPATSLLSTDPAEREREMSGLVRAVRLAVPVPKVKPISKAQRLTLGLKAESLDIASHHHAF